MEKANGKERKGKAKPLLPELNLFRKYHDIPLFSYYRIGGYFHHPTLLYFDSLHANGSCLSYHYTCMTLV